jgi:hypothetical protein
MRKINLTLRRDPYGLISDAVESAILSGIHKYQKYSEWDKPDEAMLTEKIHQYIMLDLSELIDWDRSA